MNAVCLALGLARSNVHVLRSRPASWVDGRTKRTPHGDDQLLADIREQIAELPSYGYRRACALVNRKRASSSAQRVNPKRGYRVMAGNTLLLPKAPPRPLSSRPLVVSCGTQQSESLLVVEPGGHVGRLHLSLSTCPPGHSQESGDGRWSGGAVHQLRISANVTDDFGERDRFERSVLSCAGWIVGSGCLKVVERLRG